MLGRLNENEIYLIPDATLSVSGVSADAKSVVDRFNELYTEIERLKALIQ